MDVFTTEIAMPIWAFLLLLTIAIVALFDRAFVPGVRWFLRQRVNRAIEEVNTRLKISLRPFHLTKRQVLIDRLVYDAEVIEAMQAHAREHDMPHEVAQVRVAEYAREIVPAFNAYIYFRVGYWLAKKIARVFYRIHVGFEQQQRLAGVDPNATIVFVMNHRSNMDYILVGYLVSEESTLSYAVGEWARVWPLQTLIKAMGAFFVRRNSGNPLYRKVLERYVYMATEQGVCQAVFLEGGLSHDGRMRPPKLGFLDYIVRHFDPDKGRDIVFIPVAVNYDRVIEDRSLLHRRAPDAPKRSKWFVFRTTARFLLKTLSLPSRERRRRFGYGGVNFSHPISLAAWCHERNIRFNQMDREERFRHVGALAEELMAAVAHVMPVLPAPLVASVFHAAGDAGLTAFEIKARVYALFDGLKRAGAPLRDEEKPRERTIMRAVEMLEKRGLLLRDGGVYRVNPAETELLEFYANSLAHWTRTPASPRPLEASRPTPHARAATG